MNLESLEKIEIISPSEFANDSVEPIAEYNQNSQEQLVDTKEDIESMQSRFEMTEIVTDLEMTEGIADYLETVDELKYENWSKLSLSERAEVLNRIEQNVAAIEHRPALKVELEELQPRSLGYQCAAENKIVLNTLYVGANSREQHREVIDTIIHEGRHAYQHYNTDVKTIHESLSEVRTWYENFYNPEYKYYHSGSQKILIPYHDGTIHDVDYRLYYYQPVEIDARNFAHDVWVRLEEKGFITPKEEHALENNEVVGEVAAKDGVEENLFRKSETSPFESGFDAEHPMPTYDQLRNAGFSDYLAKSILYGESHTYSQKELFHCLYESDDPVKAYNEMMDAKVKASIAKTDELIKDIENEFGIKV